MEIIVQVKNVYGNDLVYPVCEKAKLFATLTQSRTLTLAAIATIKALGYKVTVKQPEPVTLDNVR